QQFPASPLVFLIGQYYAQGVCNGVPNCTGEMRDQLLKQATANAIPIGPDVWVLQGAFSGGPENGTQLYTPPTDVVAAAQAAASAKQTEFENHPGAFANIGHNLLVLAILALILILPGWLASSWFGSRSAIDRMALIPGMSVVMLMLSGIGMLAVWRGSLT